MKLPEEFQASLDDLLAQLRRATGSYKIVVAGGCLRDALHGIQPKDIDVFIRVEPEQAVNLVAQLQAYFPFTRTEFDLSYAANPDVNLVIDLGFRVQGIPVQVICMTRGDTALDMVERIDIGLCQVGYGECGLFYTTAFETDFAEKRMTVTKAESDAALDRSIKRYERLLKKYPGYSLILPLKRMHFAVLPHLAINKEPHGI